MRVYDVPVEQHGSIQYAVRRCVHEERCRATRCMYLLCSEARPLGGPFGVYTCGKGVEIGMQNIAMLVVGA